MNSKVDNSYWSLNRKLLFNNVASSKMPQFSASYKGIYIKTGRVQETLFDELPENHVIKKCILLLLYYMINYSKMNLQKIKTQIFAMNYKQKIDK